jgi:hypothetical protein
MEDDGNNQPGDLRFRHGLHTTFYRTLDSYLHQGVQCRHYTG